MYSYGLPNSKKCLGEEPVEKICDCVDCENEATEQIEVSAGKYGSITLSLCKNCVPIFQDSREDNDKMEGST